jgi:thiol-disulfide isomerase/thioredoxin
VRPFVGNGAGCGTCCRCDTATTLPNANRIGSLSVVRVRRSLFSASLVAALLVAVLVGWWWSRDDDTYVLDETMGSLALNKVSEGEMFAEVDVEDGDGNVVSTEVLVGSPLIVNFWFSTCESCRREFPVLVDADERYPDLRVVGINLSDSSETAAAFTARFGATFETYFDRDGRLTSAMGIATAPVTLLVDAGGVVRRQLTGEITAESLAAAIAEAFPS